MDDNRTHYKMKMTKKWPFGRRKRLCHKQTSDVQTLKTAILGKIGTYAFQNVYLFIYLLKICTNDKPLVFKHYFYWFEISIHINEN
jgi:hypothetical protein